MLEAKTVVVVQYPRKAGPPSAVLGEHFAVHKTHVDDCAPVSGGVLVRVAWMSADPYMLSQLRAAAGGEGPPPGAHIPVVGFVAGQVVHSNVSQWKPGDFFSANLPLCTVQQVTDLTSFIALSPYIDSEADLSLGLGLLGMPGSTAYAGVDVMHVTAEDRVWVSACTGAVGSLVGQICRNVKKCQLVVGSCGSRDKCEQGRTQFGYHECFNYKDEPPAEALTRVAPDGVDFVFECVGGEHFEAAVGALRPHGRLAVCGAISGYVSGELSAKLPLGVVIYKQLDIRGFVCVDWLYGKRGRFLQDMALWYKQGLVTKQECVFDGIGKWPEAFAAVLQRGSPHVGKIVVRV